jgi:lipoyl(octanoyl) transferase
VDQSRAADAHGHAPISLLEPTRVRVGPAAADAGAAPAPGPLVASWLGRLPYRSAWALQKELAARRAAGEIGDQLLLVEHEPVLTLGRHADEGHVRAAPETLAARGIQVIRVERGGEVTYHGPGQLVAYPIVAIARRGLLVRPLVRALEAAMTETCAALGVTAGRRDGHPGCWVDPDGASPRKIGALGIRIERGVTYHGIALNVDPDLREFELIDPCGMPDVVSTSIAAELGRTDEPPSTEAVRNAAWTFARAFAAGIDADLSEAPGDGPAPAAPAR